MEIFVDIFIQSDDNCQNSTPDVTNVNISINVIFSFFHFAALD